MVFEKITLVELRVEDAHVGGGLPVENDDERAHESMDTVESNERRSMGGRVRRAASLGALVGGVVAVGAVARRIRGRRGMDDTTDEHEIALEGEDDVELTA
ncbi:hypothetical protein [Haloarchaeobius sp. FL176]|uniref:hypothetical protein n=1 Tax=Haloarchaeobius sp. FL176 TaxID=2967129 RepID=UPI0021478EF1|nr:hypothetical protein [Haloarchaeobius sp. FL176]